LTKTRMLAIEAASVVSGAVNGSTGHLILTTHGGTTIDAGYVWGTVVDASTTLKGIIQIATDAEAAAGTVTTKAVTPANLAPIFSSLQPLDSDLTAIAALTPTNDDIIQRKGGVWVNRTMAQLGTDLSAIFQAADSDLTTIAGLTATTNNMIQSVSGAWASRTPAQVKTALAIAEADVTNLVTDLAAKAPLASPSFTGKMTVVSSVHTPVAVSLSSGHAAIDANAGDIFDIAATANFTLDNPTNPTNGQVIHLRITQDATGSRILTLGTAWNVGLNTVTLSTGANKRDHLIAQYHSGSSKWDITGFQKGF
jgi:hypothetical protein